MHTALSRSSVPLAVSGLLIGLDTSLGSNFDLNNLDR